MIRKVYCFDNPPLKIPLVNCFLSFLKRKAGVFKFLQGLKSVFEMLRVHDGLVWTAGLTVEIELRFKFLLPSRRWLIREAFSRRKINCALS